MKLESILQDGKIDINIPNGCSYVVPGIVVSGYDEEREARLRELILYDF